MSDAYPSIAGGETAACAAQGSRGPPAGSSRKRMKLLAVTSAALSAARLRSAIGDQPAGDVEVMVIAPALHESALRFWMSDADEAIATAARVEEASVAALAAEGVPVAGDVGESDIEAAIRDALVSFPADRILLFTHPRDAARYREDVDPDALAEELGVAVERREVAPDEPTS
jgi:hypothetical protein